MEPLAPPSAADSDRAEHQGLPNPRVFDLLRQRGGGAKKKPAARPLPERLSEQGTADRMHRSEREDIRFEWPPHRLASKDAGKSVRLTSTSSSGWPWWDDKIPPPVPLALLDDHPISPLGGKAAVFPVASVRRRWVWVGPSRPTAANAGPLQELPHSPTIKEFRRTLLVAREVSDEAIVMPRNVPRPGIPESPIKGSSRIWQSLCLKFREVLSE